MGDAGSEACYRYLITDMDRVVPFVPNTDEDWNEVKELAEAAERVAGISAQEEVAASVRRKLSEITSKAEAYMKRADELELESQKLRAIVSDMEGEFQALEKTLEAEEKKLKELRGEKEPEAVPDPPAASPPKKQPARKKAKAKEK